jgi:hypothetical protein
MTPDVENAAVEIAGLIGACGKGGEPAHTRQKSHSPTLRNGAQVRLARLPCE